MKYKIFLINENIIYELKEFKRTNFLIEISTY